MLSAVKEEQIIPGRHTYPGGKCSNDPQRDVGSTVANDAQASFILIKGPELLNKYVGESDEQLRDLFERARSSKPCIVFFDEMDSVMPPRANTPPSRALAFVNALLAELDGASDRGGVYVIGTTSHPELIDEA
ncbi:hypothetical protein E4U12_000820, partial [Claviceps purpurea]